MLKKFFNVFLSICLISLISGCGYFAYQSYYTELSDYAEIWDLNGFNNKGITNIFPKSIEQSDVEKFYCRYDEQLPLGEGIQIFLKMKYNDKALFDTESKNIANVSFRCDEYFPDDFEAYAVSLGESSFFEYALIEAEQQEIYYIYLQCLPKKEIEFEHKLLPKNYSDYGETVSE